MRRRPAALLALAALAVAQTAGARTTDPDNPTCPRNPNWSSEPEMRLTVQSVNGRRVLVAEGVIDRNLPARLQAALEDGSIGEIRLRSPGGDARAGNRAARLIRRAGVSTRIPGGWACAGSCAFMFMGGVMRTVELGGLFIVQMFTHTANREIRRTTALGEEVTADLMTEIARSSARMATEDHDLLIRLGIARALLTDIVYRQSAVPRDGDRSTRRCLTPAELAEYNITSGISYPANRERRSIGE